MDSEERENFQFTIQGNGPLQRAGARRRYAGLEVVRVFEEEQVIDIVRQEVRVTRVPVYQAGEEEGEEEENEEEAEEGVESIAEDPSEGEPETESGGEESADTDEEGPAEESSEEGCVDEQIRQRIREMVREYFGGSTEEGRNEGEEE